MAQRRNTQGTRRDRTAQQHRTGRVRRSQTAQAGSSSEGRQRPTKATQTAAPVRRRTEQSSSAASSGGSSERSSNRSSNSERMQTVRSASTGGRVSRKGFVSLRSKLMVMMAGMTAAAMILMGVFLAHTADTFILGTSMHKGVELAQMTGALVQSQVSEQGGSITSVAPKPAFQDNLRRLIGNAQRWGDEEDPIYSDILSVQVEYPRDADQPFGTTIIGEEMAGRSQRKQRYDSLYVPRLGDVNLPQAITIYQLDKEVRRSGMTETIPAYRYRVGFGSGEGSFDVVVDIAADTVDQVSFNLYIIIAIGVLVTIVAVLALSHVYAGHITRPLSRLVRDMRGAVDSDLMKGTRVRTNDEVGVLADEFNIMIDRLRVAQEAKVEREKAEHELNIAREVQQNLLPSQIPNIKGYELAAYYQGAKEVSGDYYDFLNLGDGQVGLIVADVSGKGIPGSMIMAVTQAVMQLVSVTHRTDAAKTLAACNRNIAPQIKRGMFVTAVYAILDTKTGRVSYASAGHNPMVVYRAQTNTYELSSAKGIAIGFDKGPLFDKTIQPQQTVLEPGDSIVMYTDGFPEAMSENNEEFGDDEFYQVVAQAGQTSAQGIIKHSVETIAKHRGRAEQSDDLTMIALRRI